MWRSKAGPSSRPAVAGGTPQGPLSPALRDVLLVALTLSAGAVDAISFLALGEVFTANMTGNVVLLGIAAGRGGSVVGPAVALVGYAIGVLTTALVLRQRRDQHFWGPRVTAVLGVEVLLQAAFLAVWLLLGGAPSGRPLLLLIALSGAAMGLQSAGVRVLSAAGISTTYITGTITALLVELATLSGSRVAWALRAGVVTALAIGAGGMVLLLHSARLVAPVLPLALTTVVVVTAGTLVQRSRRRPIGTARPRAEGAGAAGGPRYAAAMAERSSQSVTIQAPAERIMGVIADFASYPEWARSVKSAEVTETDAAGRARTVHFVVDAGPIKDEYTLAYDWAADGCGVSWHLVGSSQVQRSQEGSYELEERAESKPLTVVTYTLVVETTMPMLGMLKRKGERMIMDTALKELKKRVEGPAAS